MEGTQKWEISGSSKVDGVKPEQAWSLLFDNYYNLHKYYPSVITSCRNDNGIRYSTISFPGKPAAWIKDRMVKTDHAERSYTYEVLETSSGPGNAVGTIKVLPDGTGDGSVIELSTVSDEASHGWNRSEFEAFVQGAVSEFAKTIQDVVNDIGSN